jgi:probable O-glycosylation ligase (exosortase A-associated)
VPFLFRTRVQIEAMLLTMLFAISGTVMAFAIKAVLSGGGYGMQLGLFQENSLLGEGSTLAATALAMVPIALSFARESMILPWRWVRLGVGYGYATAAIVTALGSYTRTGFVALIALAAVMWWRSHRKVLLGLVLGAGAAVAISTMGQDWKDRMATIPEYGGEVSALTRIGVWKWTLKFVSENPLGGGFDAYRINRTVVPIQHQPGQVLEIQSRAFHSSYFEVLGEHGIPGICLYAALLASMFLNWRSADREADWIAQVSHGCKSSTLVYMISGLFVGIAFQPFLYYFIGVSAALRRLQMIKAPERWHPADDFRQASLKTTTAAEG